MPNLDLPTIRAMNAKRLDGYWQRTITALCDEVEQLRTPPQTSDLDAIRRIADNGAPIPPWMVRTLCDRAARSELDAASFQRLAVQAEAWRLADKIGYEMLLEAAQAWADAIDRCDGIAAADEQLRATLDELKKRPGK